VTNPITVFYIIINGNCSRVATVPVRTVAAAVTPSNSQLSGQVISGQVNLNLLPVQLSGPKGTMETFAMLDPGATFSSMEASVAKRLVSTFLSCIVDARNHHGQ